MRRRPHRKFRLTKKRQLLLSVLTGLLMALMVIWFLNARLRPAVLAVAETRLSNQISQEIIAAVEEKLAEEPFAYDQLVTMVTNNAGQISALQADMTALSLLQTSIAGTVIESLGMTLEQETIQVPVGNLTGYTLLSGRGPSVPVVVLYEGNASARFENEFVDAGINQTLHRIVLCVATEADLLLPGGVYPHETETRITLAETVLLGDVPENYTYFSQFDTAEDAANAHFDFGAGQ